MNVKFISVLILLLAFHVAHRAQESKSRLNQTAPALSFNKILNYEKPVAQSSDFKSKVLIIDFWATWCAPCIASFPHLEELQNKYKDNLQIITVTNETEERISAFLKNRKMRLPIAFDADGKLAAVFPSQTLPHTIIIDGQNVVRAITTSSQVTKEIIEKLISGKALTLEEKKGTFNFDYFKPLWENGDVSYQSMLGTYREGYPEGIAVSFSPGKLPYANRRIFTVNVGLQTLYETAFQFPANIRTVIEAKDKAAFEMSKKSAYCYELIVPEAIGDKKFQIMQQQLAALFPYRAVTESRNANVKVLRKIKDATPILKKGSGGNPSSKVGGNGLTMINSPFSKVAEFLQNVLKINIVDETEIVGNYDLEIPFFNEDPKRVYEELKKIGLELVDGNRSIEMLVIYDKYSNSPKHVCPAFVSISGDTV